MTINKITFGPSGYCLGIEYSHNGRDFRLRTMDAPRGAFLDLARAAGCAGLKCAGIPDDLPVGVASISIADGDSAGTVLAFEASGYKLTLEKIPQRPVTRLVKNDDKTTTEEYIEGHPRNVFNEILRTFLLEAKFFIDGERMQFMLEFQDEQINGSVAVAIGIPDPIAEASSPA